MKFSTNQNITLQCWYGPNKLIYTCIFMVLIQTFTKLTEVEVYNVEVSSLNLNDKLTQA